MVTIPRYRSQGFALAAVLWLMAGLSIVVVLVADAAKTFDGMRTRGVLAVAPG